GYASERSGGGGRADAPVLHRLRTDGMEGLARACGINPHYGKVDPYAMAWAVVDEALRNIVCVGADPDRVALLDNFCWGNPALPDRLGGLVRATQGCHDAALAYGTPFISGKDSLNNEFVAAGGDKRTIPPTLLISSLGIVPDIRDAVTMDLKRPGNLIYLVGETRHELGGSLYHRLYGGLDGAPPAPVPQAVTTLRALHRAIKVELISAIHDLSEGGLAVAAAEMCIAGRCGLQLTLDDLIRSADVTTDAAALFSESSTRFLVEVAPEYVAAFEACLKAAPFARVGKVADHQTLQIRGFSGDVVVQATVSDLTQTWQSAEIA
ncbi:MAG: phosphoribosylformylglycinamidine synthase subunit PurL, partial [Anaerolineae bacterium]|nr:phosphoribosylformylglycinamidine synthase subunit PurL [Anaerolineae bacterium]